MKSIVYIINSHFWKSITGPFFAFGFPIIFIAILGTMLGYDQVLGGILSIPTATVSLTILPVALFEFKSSSLLKRIGVTSIKPWMFMLAISSYYIIVMILGTIFTLLMAMIIFSGYFNEGRLIETVVVPNQNGGTMNMDIIAPSFNEVLKHVNWGGFIWANLMNIIVSTSLGLLISSLCKSTLSIQGISIPILILSEFLAAQVLPIGMVKEINALYYLSYITPFKYTSGLIVESWTGSMIVDYNSFVADVSKNAVVNMTYDSTQNIFNINESFYTFYKNFSSGTADINHGMLIFDKADKVANLIMPFVFTGLFTGIALKRFKWSNR
ncbi:hypothetical protein ACJA28_03205 [Mesomycoplasma moatsii]|uniref:hypothetical protein n=1 Tax=Mesomycoplasma moatsii TaxID=171287 RepID=UPI0003B79A65